MGGTPVAYKRVLGSGRQLEPTYDVMLSAAKNRVSDERVAWMQRDAGASEILPMCSGWLETGKRAGEVGVWIVHVLGVAIVWSHRRMKRIHESKGGGSTDCSCLSSPGKSLIRK